MYEIVHPNLALVLLFERTEVECGKGLLLQLRTTCLVFFLSHLDTIQRDSVIDEDLIIGGKRRERRESSITHHTLQRCSESGQLIGWVKQVTVLSESVEPQDTIKHLALHKRRLSTKRNSESVSLMKIQFLLTVTELVNGKREG